MKRKSGGFTLIEIMVVVVIIGVLTALVITNIGGKADLAKANATKAMISTVSSALDMFKLDQNRYPEKIEDLVHQPSYIDPTKWKQSYLKSVPLDGWGQPFQYRVPGTGGQGYDVVSYGADLKEGGASYDEDLWSHEAYKK
jgi:general secretion pathway protein G